eukprot:311822-Chlamydomonas_euryale.AAC.4
MHGGRCRRPDKQQDMVGSGCQGASEVLAWVGSRRDLSVGALAQVQPAGHAGAAGMKAMMACGGVEVGSAA